jgi:hypothetical protein
MEKLEIVYDSIIKKYRTPEAIRFNFYSKVSYTVLFICNSLLNFILHISASSLHQNKASLDNRTYSLARGII